MIASWFKNLVRVASALVCACMLGCALAPTALADTAGNTIAGGDTTTSSSLGTVGKNLYWVGGTLNLERTSVGGDVIAAGRDINIDTVSIGGNIRTGSKTVNIIGAAVAGDITSAGQDVAVGKETSCSGAYLAGMTVEFSGDAKALSVAAQTVTISGTVEGDANISASNITVEDGAVITGTLTVSSGNNLKTASGAKIGSVVVDQQ